MISRQALCSLVGLLLIGGCGGSGTGVQSGSTAQLAFAIEWPSQSRFIHQSATHIVVSAKVNNIPIALTGTPDENDGDPHTLKIVRPDPGQSITSSQVSMTSLPSGPLTFTVESFRTGESMALGKAVVPVVLVPGDNPNLEFVLETQTSLVEVTANPAKDAYVAGETIQFSAVAKQGTQIVLTQAPDFEFISSDVNVISVDAQGLGTVHRSGSADVFARERGNDQTGRDSRFSVVAQRGFTYEVIGNSGAFQSKGIEDDGTVYGSVVTGSTAVGWTWKQGQSDVIQPPAGFDAFRIEYKAGSFIVGFAEDLDISLNSRGYVRNGSTWNSLTPPSGFAFAIPYGCNSAGDVLVRYDGVQSGSGLVPYTEVLYGDGQRTVTSPVIGRHISETGIVSGVIPEGNQRRPAFWKNGQTIPVSHPPGSSESEVLSSIAGSYAHVLTRDANPNVDWLLLNGQYVRSVPGQLRGFNAGGLLIANVTQGSTLDGHFFDGTNWVSLDSLVPPACPWDIVATNGINASAHVVVEAIPKGAVDNPQNRVTLLLKRTD